jgi:beta-glucanase (GH16 family)
MNYSKLKSPHHRNRSTVSMALVLLGLSLIPASIVQATPPPGTWTLTFNDDFNGTSLDTTKWNTGMQWADVINNELQGYVPENVTVAGGVCTIKVEKRTVPNVSYNGYSWGSNAYASGCITSFNKWTQAYGYFEARVKMATGAGTWPAFWMMPDRGSAVTPLSTRVGIGTRGGVVAMGNEIDIFEYMGTWKNQTTGLSKSHSGYFWQYNPNLAASSYTMVNQLVSPDTQFHTYGVAWSPGKHVYYIDGTAVATLYGRTSVASCPEYMILNCALSTNDWTGTAVTTAQIDAGLPCTMQIDNVQVYSGTPAPVAIVNGIYETEAIAQATSSDTQSVAYDTAASNGASESLAADAAGDYITYLVPVTQTGTYNVKVRFKRAALSTSNRGQFQLSVDGVNQGAVQDEYGSGIYVEVDLGDVTFGTVGDKAFKFTVTGKNASSAGYNVNFDYIKLTPVASALPSPWVNQDIGSVGVAGSTTYASGTFTVNGSGTDIQGTADSFQYAYQAASGDCSITARVASQTNTHGGAKAGVMIRETLAADSPNMFMEVSPSFGLYYQYRTTAGGATTAVSSGSGAAPYWVRVTRVGNTFTASRSIDNVTWTTVTSTTIPMGTTVYIGLAKNSRVNTTLGTATFDNVTATP